MKWLASNSLLLFTISIETEHFSDMNFQQNVDEINDTQMWPYGKLFESEYILNPKDKNGYISQVFNEKRT